MLTCIQVNEAQIRVDIQDAIFLCVLANCVCVWQRDQELRQNFGHDAWLDRVLFVPITNREFSGISLIG